MRCTNCGWENTSDSSYCIKCNTSITGLVKDRLPGKNDSANKVHFAGTVTDAEYNGAQPAQANDEKKPIQEMFNEDGELVKCDNCGYDNLNQATNCSKCRHSLTPRDVASKNGKIDNGGVYKRTQRPFQAEATTTAERTVKTIDPYRIHVKQEQNCFLKMINRDDEENLTEELKEIMLEFSYGDVPIELNRGKLDPENMTITSRIQAELTHKDGKWYLKDRSDLKTTFVRVSEPTELRDGDIILMGDRKFIFTVPKT